MRGLWKLVEAALRIETATGGRLIPGFGALSVHRSEIRCRLAFPPFLTMEIGPDDVEYFKTLPGGPFAACREIRLRPGARHSVTRLRRSGLTVRVGDRLLLCLSAPRERINGRSPAS